MAVRNIGGIGNVKPIPIHVFIPPQFNAIHKVFINDGTTDYDVTNIIVEGEYTDGVTETIGSFNFKIDNSNETYTNTFSLYNQVKIYLDYGASATTLKFVGLLERISKKNNEIVFTGRSSAIRSIGKNITYSATSTARSTILKAITNKYFSGVIGTTGVEDDLTEITVNYFDVPFWDVAEELAKSGGRDVYIDKDFELQYFESGSRVNTTEAIVHTHNLIETGDFSPDLQEVYNKVKVYGSVSSGIPILATASSSTTLTEGDIKELKINDSSITTQTQAQERADAELDYYKDPPTVGTIISLGLPTLSPGEKLRISDPLNGLTPGEYSIQSFTHVFSNDDPFKTEVTIQKSRASIPNILKKRIKFEDKITENDNPNEMDYSLIFDFERDGNIGTHSSTTISDGTLKTDGSATGTWVSPLTTLSSNISGISPKIVGSNLQGRTFWLSSNNGTTWTEIPYEGISTTIPVGKDIKFKVSLPSATTEVTAVGALYTRA